MERAEKSRPAVRKGTSTAKRKWRSAAGSLIASSKLSSYQVQKVIKAFAKGITASQAATDIKLSYETIRVAFDQLRARMLEVGLFKPLAWHLEGAHEAEDKYENYNAESDIHKIVQRGLLARRGKSGKNREALTAEILFWHYRAGLKLTQREEASFADRNYRDILQCVRLSGPINRPLSEVGRARARVYLLERLLQDGVNEMDAMMRNYGLRLSIARHLKDQARTAPQDQ